MNLVEKLKNLTTLGCIFKVLGLRKYFKCHNSKLYHSFYYNVKICYFIYNKRNESRFNLFVKLKIFLSIRDSHNRNGFSIDCSA